MATLFLTILNFAFIKFPITILIGEPDCPD